MKITLIFLSVMVAITTQQFQRQRERLWRWSPYYYPAQPSINNYQRVYQDLPDDIQPDYRRFRPTTPILYSQNDEFNPVLAPAQYQDYFDENEYPDVQSRVKAYQQRRPVFPKQPVDDQRFLLNYISVFRATTATFTVTSSLTLTTIQSCIVASNFLDDAAKKTTCRRKRELLDSNPQYNDQQFAIVPTETQRVMPTALSTLGVIGENQVSADHDITSSKGVAPSDFSESISWTRGLSEPRFLNLFSVVSTTVTTFSFATATATKTVAIGAAGAVLCLPTGWAIC